VGPEAPRHLHGDQPELVIDDKRYNFSSAAKSGWRCVAASASACSRNPSYSGISTEFWNACAAIAGPQHWTLWGCRTAARAARAGMARAMRSPGGFAGSGSGALMRDNAEAISGSVVDAARGARRHRIEAIVASSEEALTRFANNAIHQNVAERTTRFRCAGNRRAYRARSTNRLSGDAIRAVWRAIALAR